MTAHGAPRVVNLSAADAVAPGVRLAEADQAPLRSAGPLAGRIPTDESIASTWRVQDDLMTPDQSKRADQIVEAEKARRPRWRSARGLLGRLRASWGNTREMPLVMRALCQGAMVVTPLLILALALPVTDWEVNGRTMTYRELWTSGNGAMLALCLGLYGYGAWGLAARRQSSRWVLVTASLAPVVFIAASERSIPWHALADAAICAIALYFCLFRLRAVQSFMAAASEDVPRHGV